MGTYVCNMKGFEMNVVVNARMVRPYLISSTMKNAKQIDLHSIPKMKINCGGCHPLHFKNINKHKFLPKKPQNVIKRHNIVIRVFVSDHVSKEKHWN